MAIVSRTIHRQGRYLRRQVFDLALTLMIIAGGMILFLAAMIASGITAFAALRPHTGPAGAMAIITMVLFIAAAAMIMGGYWIQAKSDQTWLPGEWLSDEDVDDTGQLHAEARQKAAARAREGASFGRQYGPRAGAVPRGASGARGAVRGAMGGGPSAQAYDSKEAGDGLETVMEYVEMTQEQLNRKLNLVRRHPVTSVGVAMGLGLLLGRSKSLRFVAKSATMIGGKMLIDHFLLREKKKS